MAEPEKESSSVQSKSKQGLLDEEIGKEFLSSWKSMSVTEDDGMDFSFETIGKGKKNAFNFDKLDMDFNLDGDFSKLSTFKVDMPDIDFSCSPEETAKPKEGNAEESSVRNGEKKKETFSFSFGFNGEAAANKMMPTNKESGRVCSKFFKRIRDTGNHSDAAPRLIQLGSKKVGGINTNSADEMREGSCKDTWLETKPDNNVAGISRIGSSRNKSGSSSNSSSSTETSETPGSQACVDPERTGLSTEAPGSTRIMSLDKKKLHSINATTTRNLSSLSIKRAPGSAVEQPASRPLAGATSTKAPEEVTRSQRNSGKLITLPGGNSEKEEQLTLTSSLKRNTYEVYYGKNLFLSIILFLLLCIYLYVPYRE
ncbi:uncharacterized protein At4g18490-like isoform X3 [Punica granatum]|uniref:Uncharacterized protein At4g18490-like isoform X3 n=1 Tax=Punica granatum TaxID=22663 RepID=A0A6P8DQN2_PUNGR|nr:uncharacterized protein At4g18490-like isoform X3 [Punica granatum]XP_031395596.1 uncharacterized protein At4g18490-like isoform X3 [Punica granatum]